MTPSVALCFEDVAVHEALPWTGQSLHQVALAQMRASDPYGAFLARGAEAGDYRFHLGADGVAGIVYGSGWNAYIGPGPAPFIASDELNVFGAALAVIAAASQTFVHSFAPPHDAISLNALTWRNELVSEHPPCPTSFGEVWTVGTGSVGTAALYFMSLASRDFSTRLFDHDRVKRQNLDRSPVFIASDVGDLKVEAVERYLKAIGLQDVQVEPHALHQCDAWLNREAGRPDVVIAAANEMKVRYFIEAGYPPLQLYGTTGKNWQAAGVRHEPTRAACSLCLFPDDAAPGDTACATAPAMTKSEVDAALPFLSFAAGLMTAAEVAKRTLPGFPFNPDRVIFNTRPHPHLVPAPLLHRAGCFCESRDRDIHAAMLAKPRTTPAA